MNDIQLFEEAWKVAFKSPPLTGIVLGESRFNIFTAKEDSEEAEKSSLINDLGDLPTRKKFFPAFKAEPLQGNGIVEETLTTIAEIMVVMSYDSTDGTTIVAPFILQFKWDRAVQSWQKVFMWTSASDAPDIVF